MRNKISHKIKQSHPVLWVYIRSFVSLYRHLTTTLDFPVAYYPELKLIQFLVPKTATSTTTSLIMRKLHIPFDENNYHSIHAKTVPFFVDKKELRQLWKNADNFSFTFVRNPYARLISCYRDKIQTEKDVDFMEDFFGVFNEGMSFDEFAKKVCRIPDFWANTHFKSQSSFITFRGMNPPDFIGKIEQYPEDIQVLQQKCDLPAVTKSFNTTSKGYELSEWYTPKLAEKVYRRYKKDFDTFGYSKNI